LSEGIVLSQLQTEIHFRSSTTKLPTGNYLTFLVNSLGVTRTFISRAIKDTPLTFNNHPDCFFPGVLRTHTNVGRARFRKYASSKTLTSLGILHGMAEKRATVRSGARRKLLRNPYFSSFRLPCDKSKYTYFSQQNMKHLKGV
jgi:hypothetical protein